MKKLSGSTVPGPRPALHLATTLVSSSVRCARLRASSKRISSSDSPPTRKSERRNRACTAWTGGFACWNLR
eukprot:CAMPEP_0177712536 /NCGR_PEP_ID=MMETSP0484_2-20121128/12454_1 /TAXON_ID=354590 /ORGANISM="Rhodomonas lens, Strain RHODO" /LENGTH=70 /DNA_ID=CAMNT_0019224357 /DNA_START=476 /DNA_END=688 /DNA_ORIENTATION=-